MRHELIPLVEEQFNPRVAEALCRLAGLAAEDEDLLAGLAETLAQKATGPLGLDRRVLAEAPTPLTRRVLVQAWREAGEAGGAGPVRTEAVFVDEMVARLLAPEQGRWERALPGRVSVTFEGTHLRFQLTTPRS